MSPNPGSQSHRLAALYDGFGYSDAPEGYAAEMAWLEGGERRFGLFINGQLTEPGKTTFPSINPATGQVLGHFTQATKADVGKAYAAAKKAFPAWSALPGIERARFIYAIERMIIRRARQLQVLETCDTGKPFIETKGFDLKTITRHIGHHAALAAIFDQRFPTRRPGGVIGSVIGWNFPLMLFFWHVMPAIAAGNTIVIKLGDTTPITGMFIAEILQDVGLPPGVVNIITGDRKVGKLVVANPTPWKISFTGSTAVGRLIRKATAGSGKKLTFELGGKSPTVVFDDADLDAVVRGVIRSILFNKGEVCCAGSRLLVQESVAERLIDMLKYKFAQIRVGNPFDKCTEMGPQNSETQRKRVCGMIAQAEAAGATIWTPDSTLPEQGFFVKPTIIFCDGDNPATRQEIFGPVLVVQTFRTTAEAIALANNTEYGLACSVWTNDAAKAAAVASRINAGTRWINCTQLFDAAAGFGGTRESGWGHHGGIESMYDVTVEAAPEGPRVPFVYEPTDAPPPAATWSMDQTLRFLVGGKEARPDGQRSVRIKSPNGTYLGDVGATNRKDVRNAVQAARKAQAKWGATSGDFRRKLLMYLAEQIDADRHRLAIEIRRQTGCDQAFAEREVELAYQTAIYWAGWAGNYGGTVQEVAHSGVQVVATNEAVGVIGVRAPDVFPLLGFIRSIAPALARGNSVVAVAGEHPLSAMWLVKHLQVAFRDAPPGAINILTGNADQVAVHLTNHGGVDALWYFGDSDETIKAIEAGSTCNLKRTWCTYGRAFPWLELSYNTGDALRHANQVINTWTAAAA